MRIGTHFKRINDIIKKGNIPARVRFMLQDVIELRGNCWIPRGQQDQQLKTIDQVIYNICIELNSFSAMSTISLIWDSKLSNVGA